MNTAESIPLAHALIVSATTATDVLATNRPDRIGTHAIWEQVKANHRLILARVKVRSTPAHGSCRKSENVRRLQALQGERMRYDVIPSCGGQPIHKERDRDVHPGKLAMRPGERSRGMPNGTM